MAVRVIWEGGTVVVKQSEIPARQIIIWQAGHEVGVPVAQIPRLVDALNHERFMAERARPGDLAAVPVVLTARVRKAAT